MSRIPIRSRAWWNEAFAIASQMEPSTISESPISTHTLPGRVSMRIASAIPRPTGSPCPRDPVATSTHGISGTGAGWPWTGEPNFRKDSNSSSVIAPIALKTENSRGDAWPFDSTNRSFPGFFGSSTS